MTPDLLKFVGWSLLVFSVGSYFNVALGVFLVGVFYVILGAATTKDLDSND